MPCTDQYAIAPHQSPPMYSFGSVLRRSRTMHTAAPKMANIRSAGLSYLYTWLRVRRNGTTTSGPFRNIMNLLTKCTQIFSSMSILLPEASEKLKESPGLQNHKSITGIILFSCYFIGVFTTTAMNTVLRKLLPDSQVQCGCDVAVLQGAETHVLVRHRAETNQSLTNDDPEARHSDAGINSSEFKESDEFTRLVSRQLCRCYHALHERFRVPTRGHLQLLLGSCRKTTQ